MPWRRDRQTAENPIVKGLGLVLHETGLCGCAGIQSVQRVPQ